VTTYVSGTTPVITARPAVATEENGFDLKEALAEFARLKDENIRRNEEYYLARQAVKGNFRWPRGWPTHVPKVTRNFCKPIVERHTTYLMGRGFNWNVDRPNSLEYREAAEKAEKILKVLLDLSAAPVQFTEGAKAGSKCGRTVFKVYKKGAKGAEHACFAHCQPDYFYGVPLGPENPGEFSVVYYSYPLDILECRRRWGNRDYRSEANIAEADRYTSMYESKARDFNSAISNRRIPVVEIWTKENYALVVGGIPIYNSKNPFKWDVNGEGFIPFVVIENIRNDEEGYGESDIAQARLLNERYNYLYSRREHLADRWLTPTLVWEGAPTNYAEILTNTITGGGAIPTRLGSRLYFLAYDRDNPQVLQQMQDHVKAILDVAGMNPAAYEGAMQGSINTGPVASAQLQPMLSTVEKKQNEWTHGLRKLFAMLLQVQESIGDSSVLGEAVVNASTKTTQGTPTPLGVESPVVDNADGQIVLLSGKDITGLRSVTISWPGVLPKDDFQAAQLELSKMQAGIQSVYTTMEKLGEEFPDDEIARIRKENVDPTLRGEKVAEQMRAQGPVLRQEMAGQQQQEQMMMQALLQQLGQQGQQQPEAPPEEPDFPLQGAEDPTSIGARLREMHKARAAKLNVEGDHPVIESAPQDY